MEKKTFRLAGHEFTLKNIQTCDFMSEETICFHAELFCDGRFLCDCENEGHGGATFTWCRPESKDFYYEVYEDVRKEVWLRCKTGDIIYYDLGTVADETLSLIELYEQVEGMQERAIVFRRPVDYEAYDPYLYSNKLNGTIDIFVRDYPDTLAHEIAKLQDEGYEVLNTNIPDDVYEKSKEWRLPRNVKGRNKRRFPCDSQEKTV